MTAENGEHQGKVSMVGKGKKWEWLYSIWLLNKYEYYL